MAENVNGSQLDCSKDEDLHKKRLAKEMIEKYFFQLTKGCGNENCDNEYCASNQNAAILTPDQAAAQALGLYRRKIRLCISKSNNTSTADAVKPSVTELTELTVESFKQIIEDCKGHGSYEKLRHTLGYVFATPEYLSKSFNGPNSIRVHDADRQLSKEQLRSMEVDLDKDKDCQETIPSMNEITVDIAGLRRTFEVLGSIELQNYERAFVQALTSLSGSIKLDLGWSRTRRDVNLLNIFVIVFEIPWLGIGDFLDEALPAICKACALLPLSQQAALVRFWAVHNVTNLRNHVQTLQQLISFRVLSGNFGRGYAVNDDDTIAACVKVMRIFYCVNVLAGSSCVNKGFNRGDAMETDDQASNGADVTNKQSTKKGDPLFAELGRSVLDCRKPVVPFEDFYNEPLSDAVEMDRDFANFTDAPRMNRCSSEPKMSFMNFPFILTPAAKAMGLYYDNRIRMFNERQSHRIAERLISGQPIDPYLKLRIRRDHVVNDALNSLEMIATENASDLKKQLVVEFEGEQGIDEGGLSKEFFQLVTEEVFNPDYAMFSYNSETRNFWFNPTSFESDAQFTLIGIMLGLAIYNTVILDVRFPMVVYRKLMGRKGNFDDLQELDPTLYKGLKSLLEYSEPDIEDTFMQTFNISYKDVFGVVYHHDLKENGASIYVNHENRHEFVDLYADFLLNECVDRQFAAFRRGFTMVTDESPLALLFRPEEVEQLVCGSRDFDFGELQNATEYDGGFTAQSETITYFWSVVHELSIEDKRRLLQFTTGSDRVPVGGLGRLKLIIAKNGADQDRLPMAHTCYNVLLLPEYNNQEKLKERLLKAIDYSKGFGML